MRNTGKLFWLTVFVMTFVLGSVVFVFGAGRSARTINLPDVGVNTDDDEADVPDTTARVARISFLRGEVQIRRTGNTDWEKATLNLPIVEGDELATGDGARIEIQFNNFSHLRLDDNASLKIAVLRNEGIAVSLSLGSMSLRVTDIDKSAGYIEVDAPKTTVAVQKSGTYRIDAGRAGDTDIHLSVTNGGEARVYSDTAGFTLKSGRGARVFIDGSNSGEWETADAARLSDEFDSWTTDRDAMIAKQIKDAYYDKYYDQDIYGADDLDAFGEWVHTSQYGYVWRPYKNSLSSYADWSPYRYGHWRWVPPFGWTWVNDEPWGWATYHHGRWVYDSGYWVWSPYGYYRPSHSWWFPALVVINVINNNVCWYPLQYHHRYTAFNNHRGGRDDDHHYGGTGRPPGPGPRPSPTPTRGPRPTRTPGGIEKGPATTGRGGRLDGDPSQDRVPPNGVVAMDAKEFGTGRHGVRTAPPVIAGQALSKVPTIAQDLPDYGQVNRRITREIATDRPKTDDGGKRVQVGAADRKQNEPLDRELRNTRMFGGRPPVKSGSDDSGGVITTTNKPREPRDTGAVGRPPINQGGGSGFKDRNQNPPERDPGTTNVTPRKQPPVFDGSPRETREPKVTPTKPPPVFDSQPKEIRQPRENPPVRQPKNDPPSRDEKPRTEAPPAKQPPRTEPPSRETKPPGESPKPQPKSDPPPKVDRPEQKNRKDGEHLIVDL